MQHALWRLLLFGFFAVTISSSCNQKKTALNKKAIPVEKGYSDVNGLKMYYEIQGEGQPLVLIHGGGSTIGTSFGRIMPLLAQHHKVIAVELQAHGHTNDRNIPLSFEQDADDVATLLQNLAIPKAAVLGFSNGGNTAMQIAIRHPEKVDKLIVVAAFYKRSGLQPGLLELIGKADYNNMPQAYKEAYLKINNNQDGLHTMFQRDVIRMATFIDWDDAALQSITQPTLLVSGDKDVALQEHTVAMAKLIPNCQLAILPGGHGKCLGEITTLVDGKWTQDYCVNLFEEFLNQSKP